MKKLLFGIPIIFAVVGALWVILSLFNIIPWVIGHGLILTTILVPLGFPRFDCLICPLITIPIGAIIGLIFGFILMILGLITVAGGKKSGR